MTMAKTGQDGRRDRAGPLHRGARCVYVCPTVALTSRNRTADDPVGPGSRRVAELAEADCHNAQNCLVSCPEDATFASCARPSASRTATPPASVAARSCCARPHDLCDLPIRVFRCDVLMAETTYRGQLNLPDMVTRLLLSVAITGLSPRSFHPPGPDGARARSHRDGLPVDFVDQAISTIGADVANHFRTYHVVNHHDDGIGPTSASTGSPKPDAPIERIDDHATWHHRFESALRNLPGSPSGPSSRCPESPPRHTTES